MWEVWVYPDYRYGEGEGTLVARYETLPEATWKVEQIGEAPLRIVRVDYPASEHTAAEVIAYLKENWNFYEHRDLIADVKRHFGLGDV